MGKRKSSSKPQGPKRKDPLPTIFSCLFCNHEKSVAVRIDKKAGVGELECKVCGQRFQCGVNYLSAPIDVYSEWVDAADTVANEGGGTDTRASGTDRPIGRHAGMSRRGEDDEDRRYDGEGIVGDDEVEYE